MIKSILCFFLIFLFSSCVSSQSMIDTKEEMMTNVDKGITNSKSGYESFTNFFAKFSKDFSNGADSLKSSFIENSFSTYILSDEYIVKNRKNLITWQKSSKDNINVILKNYLKNNKIKVSYKNLKKEKKLKILNSYYFDLAKKEYFRSFSRKHKKPKNDPFLTNRVNQNNFNLYNLKILKAQNIWDLNILKTKKVVSQKALEALYGSIILDEFVYNANGEKLYFQVKSKRNAFVQNVYIKAASKEAKEIFNHKNKIKTYVFFSLKDNNLSYVGINVSYKKQLYLTSINKDNYVKKASLVLNNDKLVLKKEMINYKLIPKDIKPPSWYNNMKVQKNEIIGYGMSISYDDAKANALKDISESISLSIKSNFEINKKLSGDVVSKSIKKNVQVKTKKVVLKGTNVLKNEIQDNMNFIAVSYKIK